MTSCLLVLNLIASSFALSEMPIGFCGVCYASTSNRLNSEYYDVRVACAYSMVASHSFQSSP
ncbi:hypothetical protein Plhal703r1_c36g0131371 [Plasmopara halstedii]